MTEKWKQYSNGHWGADLSPDYDLGAGALTDGTGFWCEVSVNLTDYGPYATIEAAKAVAENHPILKAKELARENDQLLAEIATLRAAHAESARQFRFYEQQHLAKNPPDTVKAATNAEHADRCEGLMK